jgi:hypothetical protein
LFRTKIIIKKTIQTTEKMENLGQVTLNKNTEYFGEDKWKWSTSIPGKKENISGTFYRNNSRKYRIHFPPICIKSAKPERKKNCSISYALQLTPLEIAESQAFIIPITENMWVRDISIHRFVNDWTITLTREGDCIVEADMYRH